MEKDSCRPNQTVKENSLWLIGEHFLPTRKIKYGHYSLFGISTDKINKKLSVISCLRALEEMLCNIYLWENTTLSKFYKDHQLLL